MDNLEEVGTAAAGDTSKAKLALLLETAQCAIGPFFAPFRSLS